MRSALACPEPAPKLSVEKTKNRIYNFLTMATILPTMNERSADQLDSPCSATLESDLLDPYERLIKIKILGKEVQVPEKNRLLRCFQFLSLDTISYGDFCWNGECTNCQIWYHIAGQTQASDKTALACRLEVIEGMEITTLSRYIELQGINK